MRIKQGIKQKFRKWEINMIIDEAISYCEEKADCAECGTEYRQIAEWLRELKTLSARETPKKPDKVKGYQYCKECGSILTKRYFTYCPFCGQRLKGQ